MENIYLIGFMGSGKTTISYLLAERLGYKRIDLDEEIEKQEGMSIPHIFEHKGEEYFRKIEMKMLLATKELKGTVIATGGGIITNSENITFLKEQKTIYLHWSFEVLYDRVRGDSNRPLARSYEELFRLYTSRETAYQSAARLIMDGMQQSEEELTATIIKKLGEKQ